MNSEQAVAHRCQILTTCRLCNRCRTGWNHQSHFRQKPLHTLITPRSFVISVAAIGSEREQKTMKTSAWLLWLARYIEHTKHTIPSAPIEFEAGCTINSVTDKTGKSLPIVINNTMMRIDLATPIKTGESFTFNILELCRDWPLFMFCCSREGYEHFPSDNNNIYLIAHWFPRMCQLMDFEVGRTNSFNGWASLR